MAFKQLSTGNPRPSALLAAVVMLMAAEWILLVAGRSGHGVVGGGFQFLTCPRKTLPV